MVSHNLVCLHLLCNLRYLRYPFHTKKNQEAKMSFGVGVADIIQALYFVQVTYDSWKEAPEKYHAIKRRLDALRGPLDRLARLYGESQRHMSRSSQRDLDNVLFSIDITLEQLERIIAKRSDLKFWDRLRLNTREVNDLSAALDRHIQDLTCLCSSLGLEDGREIHQGQETLRNGQQDLQRGQAEIFRLVSQLLPPRVPMKTIEAVVDSVDSAGMSSSFMTDYGDEDDPMVWREFRRKAIAEGVTSRDLELYQAPLHDLLLSVGSKHKDRWRTPSTPRITFDRTEELPVQVLRRSRSRDESPFLHAGFDGMPPRGHGSSSSRSRASSRHSRSLPVSDPWEAEPPSMDEDYSTHISREHSRRRRRRRRHSHSIESETHSEIVSVHRARSRGQTPGRIR